MAFATPLRRLPERPDPARPSRRRGIMPDEDNRRLVTRLEALCDRWESKESDRCARDRRGMRLFRGEFGEGLLEQKLAITSPAPTAIMERIWSDVLRGMPEPEIESVNPDEQDAARVAEGAVRTNWRTVRMREKIANGGRLSSFTRAVGFYHYWRHELHGGIGDVDKRLIPGHRLIVDDRVAAVRDMEFVGFEEEMSRATLITLFPDKAEEIEAAAESSPDRVTQRRSDPLRPPSGAANVGGRQIDRFVTANSTQTPPYKAISSSRSSPDRKPDPLSEKVWVRFLWVDDKTPTRVRRPKIDPKTKRVMYHAVRDELGKLVMEDDGHAVIETPLGPQYVARKKPRVEIVMEDAIERKYKYWRHSVYVKGDDLLLWDVAWNGPAPISILRDRYPAYGFDAPGTALRMASLAAARAILWTIIFERLKKSLQGTYVAHAQSGLKRNTLVNDIGAVFYVNMPVNEAIKDFPVTPLDAAYFNLLDKIEIEMEMLEGVTPMQKGQAVGRADSPATYEQVADQSGGPILDRAKLVDQFIADATEIDLWFMQNHYTHEHVVEVEMEDGFSTWKEASALAIRGKFAVRVETGATLGSNIARDRAEAEQAAQMGFYALPMLGRAGHVRFWKQALRQKQAIIAKGPQAAWLLGSAGAPPAQQAMNLRARTQRSHHRPGGR